MQFPLSKNKQKNKQNPECALEYCCPDFLEAGACSPPETDAQSILKPVCLLGETWMQNHHMRHPDPTFLVGVHNLIGDSFKLKKIKK